MDGLCHWRKGGTICRDEVWVERVLVLEILSHPLYLGVELKEEV